MTTETETKVRTFEVPLIMCVTVEVDAEGNAKITGAYPDSDAGPWAFSTDQAAYEPDGEDGGWTEQVRDDDDPARIAWLHAYDAFDPEALTLFR